MNRVALMHANREFAEQLASAVDEFVPDWEADVHAAVVDDQRRGEKLHRIRDVATGGYDVIQADELVGNGPAAQLIGSIKRTPVVGYLRGWGDYTNDHGQHGWRLRNRVRAKVSVQFRTMDGIAAISEAVKAGVSDMYPAGGVEVIERPYDIDYYGGGKPLPDEHYDVLTVTNLRYEEKYDGVRVVLDGLEPLLRDGESNVAIAGGGRYLEDLREDVAQRECADQINVLGFREDIPDLLASADVFAYVSFLDGAPSTVYEAQCAGLPVVGGDAAGVPEAVGDGGIVVPPCRKGVRRGIEYALENEDKLSQASRAKMEAHNGRVAREWARFWEAKL